MRSAKNILFVALGFVLFSCNSSETKSTPEKSGIDTLSYQEPYTTKTDTAEALIDSLLSASDTTPITPDDSAGLALKARLAADTMSVKISDSVKREMRKAREYMREKQIR